MSFVRFIFVLASITMTASRLCALCSYNGVMYARTTISQEFRDSKWVVRVKVLAADNHWSDVDDSWTIYTVQVRTAYKGQPPLRMRVFTYRDSGGFYLDKGTNPDLGGEYLLFLDPIPRSATRPAQARGATDVNYPCGQSKGWNLIAETEQQQLRRLSGARFRIYNDPLPTDELPK